MDTGVFFLKILREESFIGAFIFQENGEIVFANKRMAELFGFKGPKDLLGKSFFDFLASNEQKKSIVLAALKRSKKWIPLRQYKDVKIITLKNEIVFVDAFAYTVRYKGKNAGLVLAIDRTNEKSLERLFSALSYINQTIIRESTKEKLFSDICDILVDRIGYYAVGIGYVDKNTRLVRFEYKRSVSSEAERLFNELNIPISVDPLVAYGRGTISKAYNERKVCCIHDVLRREELSYWHEYYKLFKIYYTCSVPIMKNGSVEHILTIYDNVRNQFSQEHLRLLEELQLDLSFALENIERRKRLKELSNFNVLLSMVNDLIIRSDSEEELLQGVCDLAVKYTGIKLAYVARPKEDGWFRILTSAGELGYVKNLRMTIDPSLPEGRGGVGICFRSGRPVYVDFSEDDIAKPWREKALSFGLKASAAFPIFRRGKVWGIFAVYHKDKDIFTGDLRGIAEKIALNISFALNKIDKDVALSFFNKALENTHEWALVTDEKGKIIYANKSVTHISGYGEDEIIGRDPSVFKSGYHSEEFYRELWDTINSGKTCRGIFKNKGKDGYHFYLDSVITPVERNGRVYGFVDLSRDITQIIKLKNELELQARLYNILYRIADLSMKIEDKYKFVKEVVNLFVKTAQFDAAIFIDRQLNIKHYFVKDASFSNLPYRMKFALKYLAHKGTEEDIFIYDTMRNGRVRVENNLSKLKNEVLRRFAERFDIKSSCSIPVLGEDAIVGVIVLMSTHRNVFSRKMHKLIDFVSNQISYTLSKIEKDRFHNMVLRALDSSFEIVIITDDKFNIVYANDTIERVSKYKKEELIGKHHSIFSSGKYSKDFIRNFYATLESGRTFSNVMTYRAKDGNLFRFFVTIYPYKVDGKIRNYITIGKEISEDKSILNELRKLLYRDALTDLFNTMAFVESVDGFIKSAKSEGLLGAIMVVNPISFKSINEAFGYEKGNVLLRFIAQRLTESVYERDMLAKLESDRFGILIKDLKNEEDVFVVASKVLSDLRKPYNIDGKVISLSFNIGVSVYPKDGETAVNLISKAQVALADARMKGENKIGFFKKDFEKEAARIIDLKLNLERAIVNREFKAYYQPYMDRERRIAGAESLMRWVKDGRVVSPAEFIPYLEKTDLIKYAEEFMIDSVLSFIKRRNVRIPISVNLSQKSLDREDIFNHIVSRVNLFGVDPHLLKLEIIERSFMDNFGRLKRMMVRFKEHGIGFSIDDFGTGYSSLSYLSELNAEIVKIDISFVRKIEHSEHTRNVVESIIFLSRRLGMKTVAEGVETEEQFKILREMGCDYFQGYLFYNPLSEEEFSRIL